MKPLTSLQAVILFLAITLLILGSMLLPGYILTLDMLWTPELFLSWSSERPNNSFPIYALLYALGFIFPSWLVQKFLLITLFFLLLYIPWRFLIFTREPAARLFAALLYTLNPFVYTRMLAGQWGVLLGYAAYPLLLYALHKLTTSPDKRSALTLLGALLALSLGSIHMLYIGLLFALAWLVAHFIKHFLSKNTQNATRLAKWSLLTLGAFLLVSLYWLTPAVLRSTPLEERFNQAHYEVFSAAGNEGTPTPLNTLVLSGFWAEDEGWQYYFAWPQDTLVFWFAVGFILALVLVGLYQSLRDRERRFIAVILLIVALFSYITAMGASDTWFKSFNLLLYQHFPGWSGLRDSTKLLSVLALTYALLGSLGMERVLEVLKNRKPVLATYVTVALLTLPIFFGLYQWGGFQKQLAPVWYPESWYEAKIALEKLPESERVLVLPWYGYISLPFANQLIVANPVNRFFNNERLIVSKGVDVGKISTQEIDKTYLELDEFVREIPEMSMANFLEKLEEYNIRYILVVENTQVSDPYIWLFPAMEEVGHEEHFHETLYEMGNTLKFPFKRLLEGEISLYDTDEIIHN